MSDPPSPDPGANAGRNGDRDRAQERPTLPGDDDLGDHVREEFVAFVRGLRRRGVAVPANAGQDAVRALLAVGLTDRERARVALRAALLSDWGDFETFDRLFARFWDRLTDTGPGVEVGGIGDTDGQPAPLGSPDSGGDGAADIDDEGCEEAGGEDDSDLGGSDGLRFDTAAAPDGDPEEVETALYSPAGRRRAVSGDLRVTGADFEAGFRDLTRALAGLQGRRHEAGGDHPDPRRVLRESVSTGGTVLSVPERERAHSAVRALVLVDVSRSVLDTLDRGFLVEFLRHAADAWRDVRVFFFDEDLREVTDAVDAPSPAAARAALAAAETEWGGGTRIGASLGALRERAPGAIDRRAVTFLISDGLEQGEVDQLERELSWLSRRTQRLFWLNPLAAAEGYEPTARGMAAALPYLDGLFAFASPADVVELAGQLLRQGPGGRVGYEFDARRAATGTDTATTGHDT